MTMVRILITGSRTWSDSNLILRNILNLQVQQERIVIVHGACPRGADRLADVLANNHAWAVERHPANWERYGNSAGHIRNAHMVRLGAHFCLAFIKDGSPGATRCADLAEKAGIPTQRVIQ